MLIAADQGHRSTRPRQHAAEVTADGAGAKHRDLWPIVFLHKSTGLMIFDGHFQRLRYGNIEGYSLSSGPRI
jgi:hypothetical protein